MGLRYYVLLFTVFGWTSLAVRGQSSVLSQGEWVRIGVTQTGLHRIDVRLLTQAGFPATLDPRHLQLFGSGGGILPQANAAARPDFLSQNAIFVAGEADGRFDSSDYLLFYAKGPHRVEYDSSTRTFRHQLHYAADTAYYFLTVGTDPGLRLAERPSIQAGPVLTTFDDYQFHEVEETNVVLSGREWYGEYLSITAEKTTEFRVPGLVPDAPLRLRAAVMAAAPTETQFQFSLNGQMMGTLPVAAVRSGRYDLKGIDSVRTFQTALSSVPLDGRLRVAFRYDRANQLSAQGYLNWLGLHTRRSLQVYDGQTMFRAVESLRYPAVTFQFREAPSALRVWDVTDPARPALQQIVRSGTQTQFGVATLGLREFVAFHDESKLLQPVSVQKIPNQDLRGLAVPQLLIVTAPAYLFAAQRLAEHRRRHDTLQVSVVTTIQVFNEFSSGQTDPTAIRDFVRHLNRRTPGTLRYLLLLGDATYDFRNRRKLNVAAGYVPTYESRESLDPINSYSSDDYFGFLEDTEGEWAETHANDHTVDVGIGRLPAKSLSEAQAMVDKLIAYDSPKARGSWRTRLAYVGDDGDFNVHQKDADYLAQDVQRTNPAYETQKILLDAFPQSEVPTGPKAKTVNEAIARAVREGVFILNYTGHGGESGWAEEQILTRGDVQGWRNFTRMPILMTATCEFGRYDNPGSVSGAELALLNPRGGAIGLLTTARPVYSTSNFLVNDAFQRTLFRALSGGQSARLGGVFRQTKNESLSGRNNRNFTLLGDPSMRLPLPEVRLAVTRLNEKPVSGNDTLRARQTVSLDGEIRAASGDSTRLSGFTGTALVTVYGPERTALTRGTESQRMSYLVREDVWAQSQVWIQNGRFRTTFVVPARADSTPGTGLIRLYALRADSLREGIGSFAFAVRGRQVITPIDTRPPVVQAWLNTENFRDGDDVSANPTLLMRLSDERALDWGPGSVVGILNDTLRLDLTRHLIPRMDDPRSATLSYSLSQLPVGSHALRLRARDADGTVAEVVLHFFVRDNTNADRLNVVTAPNPFREKTQFRFEHDLAGNDAAVDLEVYTMNGQLIQKISTIAYQMPSPYNELFWSGTTLSKQTLPRGFYFYRIFVRSLTDNRQRSASGKLFYAP